MMENALETYDARGMGTYRGRVMRAVGQLHRVVMERIEKLNLPRGAAVLELGAGTGAFSLRLVDRGFVVHAVDLERIDLDCPNFSSAQIDLNTEFAENFADKTFDLIVCMEVIEHIENPFHMFRQGARLLKPGGHLVVTSPNMESWMSRLMFLVDGSMPWFAEKGWRENRHTIPHFTWQMPIMASEAGFELVDIGQTSNRFMMAAGPRGPVAMMAKYFGLVFVRPFMRGHKNGDINVYCYELQ